VYQYVRALNEILKAHKRESTKGGADAAGRRRNISQLNRKPPHPATIRLKQLLPKEVCSSKEEGPDGPQVGIQCRTERHVTAIELRVPSVENQTCKEPDQSGKEKQEAHERTSSPPLPQLF